jgi:DNA-binding protein YbaB
MFNPISQISKVNKMRKLGEQKKKEMQNIKVTGESDKSRVKITLNGLYEYVSFEIDDALMGIENKEMLKKAIIGAFSDAKKKLEKELAKSMDISQLMEMLG